jgi:hypothetical protein
MFNLFLIIVALLFLNCMIKSLNGSVVYSSIKQEKTETGKKDEGMRKPKQAMYIPIPGEASFYTGLRRSSYGLSKRNSADAWWAVRAKEFSASTAAAIEGVDYIQPCIIQIVSGYRGDGGTVIEFDKPETYTGSTKGMVFSQRGIDHEKALTIYDEQGVKAIIQFEPGNSDILANIQIAHQAFGHHTCIIGYGVDAEWYYTRESNDTTGLPIEDEDAEAWMNKILSLNPEYTLFLKHWDPSHMPLEYRHPNLWFLSDSQIFPDIDSLMDDFSYWANTMKEQVVGYQYGYPSDRKWWKNMGNPPVGIAQRIVKDIPLTRYLFWVDFTADEVDFR